MPVLRSLVELEVRRADDDDGIGAHLGGVRRERDRVRRRLRTAVHGHLEPSIGRLQEEVRCAAPLLDAEQDPLAGSSEREDPVEPRADEEVHERREGVLVERAALIAERRHRRRQRTP